jgi:hypothetical protein
LGQNSLAHQLLASGIDFEEELKSPEKIQSNTKLELESIIDQPFLKIEPIE